MRKKLNVQIQAHLPQVRTQQYVLRCFMNCCNVEGLDAQEAQRADPGTPAPGEDAAGLALVFVCGDYNVGPTCRVRRHT
jgi:hypothetical protein